MPLIGSRCSLYEGCNLINRFIYTLSSIEGTQHVGNKNKSTIGEYTTRGQQNKSTIGGYTTRGQQNKSTIEGYTTRGQQNKSIIGGYTTRG